MIIISMIIIFVYLLFLFFIIFREYLPKKIICDILGYHGKIDIKDDDGVSLIGECTKCKKNSSTR